MSSMMGPGVGPPGLLLGDLPFPGPSIRSGDAFAGPSKETFYKTRLCRQMLEGRCTYGDRCNYAHSEAELRSSTAEGEQIKDGRSQDGARAGPPSGEGGSKGVKGSAYKSRLCTRFMQSGTCPYGPSCHFAHGYDDMKAPDGQEIGALEGPVFDPFRRSMMLPGGPMMPPEFMLMGMAGPLAGSRPRPPPGPPPLHSSAPGSPAYSPETDYRFDVQRTPSRLTSEVPYLDRAKAMCALLGVGHRKPRELNHDVVETAIASLQTGEAFQSNVYADALEVM